MRAVWILTILLLGSEIIDAGSPPPMHPGWPSPTGANLETPIAADLDGDGKLEILWGQIESMVVRREDGTFFPGWPQDCAYSPSGPPSVTKVNGTMVVGLSTTDFDARMSQVSLWRADGTPLPGWPKMRVNGNMWVPHNLPVVFADIDGDGQPEVVYITSTASNGTGSAVIHVDRIDGTSLPSWPVTLPIAGEDIYDGSPAVADVDGDGFLDLAVVTFHGKIFLYHHTGVLFAGWPVIQGSSNFLIGNKVSFADVNNDGQLELVVATYDGLVGIYNSTGVALTGWPRNVGVTPSAPAYGDLDGDGIPEIVLGTQSDTLQVLHWDGTSLPGWPKTFTNRVNAVTLADLDSDGYVDILATDGDQYAHAWNSAGKTLAPLGFPFRINVQYGFGFYSAPIVADIDRDGLIEFFAIGESEIRVWDLPTSFNPFLAPHPIFMCDNQHTSRHAPEPTIHWTKPLQVFPNPVTQFSIDGAGFLKGMRAFIGDREQSVSNVTATSLQVTANNLPAPMGRYGFYPLTVTNINSGSSEPVLDAIQVWAGASATPSPTPTATPSIAPTPRPTITVYSQTPAHAGGAISDGGIVSVADDFRSTEDAMISHVRWWGGYLTPPPVPDTFTLRLFADVNGHPGELIRTIDLGPITKTRSGFFGSQIEFEYEAGVQTPFLVRGNVTYWISIVNPPYSVWNWEVSTDHAVSGGSRSFGNPVTGPWEPYDLDFAFQLESSGGGLANISTRASVGTGDNPLIAGFIVIGADPRRVLLRAIGPSLSVGGRLENPVLELHDESGAVVGLNDDWKLTQIGGVIVNDQRAEIEATGAAPTDDHESAIIATLNPNSVFTAVVRGVAETSGIGVAEVYDLEHGAAAKLANISTRGFVQTGDGVMIAGLIVRNQSGRVIVRALGPSLKQAGVPNTLQDPSLELRNNSGALVAQNDNWRSDQEAEIIATTIPPSQDLESALVSSLPAGAYTAIIRDEADAIGNALIEVYDLDP